MVTSSSTREAGTVKWFNDAKGIGFLIDSNGDDVFVHYRSIEPGTDGFKTLETGELVTFLPVRTDKGRSAVEITKA